MWLLEAPRPLLPPTHTHNTTNKNKPFPCTSLKLQSSLHWKPFVHRRQHFSETEDPAWIHFTQSERLVFISNIINLRSQCRVLRQETNIIAGLIQRWILCHHAKPLLSGFFSFRPIHLFISAMSAHPCHDVCHRLALQIYIRHVTHANLAWSNEAKLTWSTPDSGTE